MARDCRTRKEDSPRSGEKGEKVEITPKAVRAVTCFVCGEIGHKSPSCFHRRDKAAKRVMTKQTEPEVLGESDLLVNVHGCSFPATLDTGASITLLPKEFVKEEALIGETEQVRGFRRDTPFQTAPVAKVSIQVGGMTLRRGLQVAQDLSRLFYWPSLWKDLRVHCQECEVCQRYSKLNQGESQCMNERC